MSGEEAQATQEKKEDTQVPDALDPKRELPDELKAEDFGPISGLVAPILLTIHHCIGTKTIVGICRRVIEKLSDIDPRMLMSTSDIVDAYNWLRTASADMLQETLGPLEAMTMMLINPRRLILHWLEAAQRDHVPALTRCHALHMLMSAISTIADTELNLLPRVKEVLPAEQVSKMLEYYQPAIVLMSELYCDIVDKQRSMSDEEAIAFMIREGAPVLASLHAAEELHEKMEDLIPKQGELDRLLAGKKNCPGFAPELPEALSAGEGVH